MSKTALFVSTVGILLIVSVSIFSIWYMGTGANWSSEAREKDFQSKLAECNDLTAKYGDDWFWRVPDYCGPTFEEYSRRIDKAEKQSVNDGTTPEPPDTEY